MVTYTGENSYVRHRDFHLTQEITDYNIMIDKRSVFDLLVKIKKHI